MLLFSSSDSPKITHDIVSILHPSLPPAQSW